MGMQGRLVGSLIVLAAGVLAPGARAEPRSAGKWLVDLGRDYPLTPQAGLSRVDAEITLLFMQAAVRVEPDLAEAYRWQVDLLCVLGRQDEVRSALEAYVQRAGDDIPARLAWVQACLDARQTAESRVAFCREELARPGTPPVVASDLHCRLADYYWNRGEYAAARREAEKAVSVDTRNLAARRLLMQFVPPEERPIHQVGLLLARLVMAPSDNATAQALAGILDLRGLPAEAEIWYRQAQEVIEAVSPGEVPADLLVARAKALIEMNHLDEAEALAKRVVEAEPTKIDTVVLRAQVALLKGDMRAAEGHFNHAAAMCKSTMEEASRSQKYVDTKIVANIGWVYAHYAPNLEISDRLSRTVLAVEPGDVVAQRALGAVQIRQGEFAQAESTLAPVADQDLWAAIELARALKAAGRQDEAVARLRLAATQPADFEQRYEIRSLCKELKIDPPATQPAVAAMKSLADALRPEVRDYPFHPNKYLSASISIDRSEVPPGEPWWCTIRLANVGPFPITIGSGLMIEPVLLVVVETKGDRPRSSGGSILVMLDKRLQLAPGETLEIAQTLDIGAIRSGMIGTPHVAQEVQVASVLNPESTTDANGRQTWRPGLGGFRLPAIKFRRVGLNVEPALMRDLLARARSSIAEDRITAMQQLAMLLAEHQHLAAGRLRYAAQPIDVPAVQSAILAMAADDNWYVRARLAECMRWFLLDETTMPTAMRLLNDPHWLVRSLARRLLADQQGDKFLKVLESTSRADPDPWAAQFARALLERQSGAAQTQPAQTRPTSSQAGP